MATGCFHLCTLRPIKVRSCREKKKKERKEEKKKTHEKSKPPLCRDKIIPYKSSCTFKLENKELLTRPRLQFDGGGGRCLVLPLLLIRHNGVVSLHARLQSWMRSLSLPPTPSPRRPLSPQTVRTLRVLRTPLPHWLLWELWGRSRRQRRAHIYTNLLKVFPNFCPVELTLRGYKNVGKGGKDRKPFFFIFLYAAHLARGDQPAAA